MPKQFKKQWDKKFQFLQESTMKSPSDLDCRLASWQTEHLHSLWKLSKTKHHSPAKKI